MNTDSITLWKQRIETREASGLKVDEWCAQNQITRHTYYYWHRKIADLTSEPKVVPMFAEVLANAKEKDTSSDESAIHVSWNDISIIAADQKAVELAVYFLHCLQKQC